LFSFLCNSNLQHYNSQLIEGASKNNHFKKYKNSLPTIQQLEQLKIADFFHLSFFFQQLVCGKAINCVQMKWVVISYAGECYEI